MTWPTAIWELEIFGGRPSWKATGLQLQSGTRATTAIWELGIFWWQVQLEGDRATTAIWELEIFWVAGVLLCPEMRWSEMELVLGLSAVSTLRNE